MTDAVVPPTPWRGWRLRWPGGTDRPEIGDGGALSFELRGFSSKTTWDVEDVAAAQRAYPGHRVALDAGGRILLVYPPGTDTAGAERSRTAEHIVGSMRGLPPVAVAQLRADSDADIDQTYLDDSTRVELARLLVDLADSIGDPIDESIRALAASHRSTTDEQAEPEPA